MFNSTNSYKSRNLCGEFFFSSAQLQLLGLATETAGLVSFSFFVVGVFVSGYIQTFTSASCHLTWHLAFSAVLGCSESFTVSSLSPSLASHSFTPASRLLSLVHFSASYPLSSASIFSFLLPSLLPRSASCHPKMSSGEP